MFVFREEPDVMRSLQLSCGSAKGHRHLCRHQSWQCCPRELRRAYAGTLKHLIHERPCLTDPQHVLSTCMYCLHCERMMHVVALLSWSRNTPMSTQWRLHPSKSCIFVSCRMLMRLITYHMRDSEGVPAITYLGSPALQYFAFYS